MYYFLNNRNFKVRRLLILEDLSLGKFNFINETYKINYAKGGGGLSFRMLLFFNQVRFKNKILLIRNEQDLNANLLKI